MPDERTNIKETITSVVIAFIMAFVFRGFVVEAFMIPTGSMAPTLLGAHMRFQGPETGYSWTIGPQHVLGDNQTPAPLQGVNDPVRANDPMSRTELGGGSGLRRVPLRAGDRIFVLKYLYSVFDPRRFDVVVFKNPINPSVNYIKRLVGLPNEQLALIDGDVFSRAVTGPVERSASLPPGAFSDRDTWSSAGWTIARKPEHVQRSVWQLVFSSEFTPRSPQRAFRAPWIGRESGWDLSRTDSYRFGSADAATLEWDTANRPVFDLYPYNQALFNSALYGGALATHLGAYAGPIAFFPVSDLRVAFGVRPESAGLNFGASILCRGHEFRARVERGRARIEMRPVDAGDEPTGDWRLLGEGSVGELRPGAVANVDLWHYDQRLDLFINGRRVARGEYDWTPAERVRYAAGLELEEVAEAWPNSPLSDWRRYRPARVRLDFSGSPFNLYRVGLWRDIHYQSVAYGGRNELGRAHSKAGQPAMCTHPMQTPTLGPDEFFTCGDNSPSSLDARLFDAPHPWVAERFNPKLGVVDRHLLIGKAFFVYFPALEFNHGIPIPDFGRMRWIW